MMAQIIDSIIRISINEAISTVSTTSVNTMAVVGPASQGPAFVECSCSEDAEVFGTDSLLYGMVASTFSQSACPAKVIAIKAGCFAEALDAVKNAQDAALDFYHIVAKFGDDIIPSSTEFTKTGGWNAYLGENFKIIHLELDDTSNGFASIRELSQSLLKSTSDRVALYQHHAAGNIAASIVSIRCALDSARGTFAHKKVKNVEYDGYKKSDFDALVADNINVYTVAAGESRVFMGSTSGKNVLLASTGEKSPASFIDGIAKDDWIRFNIQTKIYSLLGEANDGHGVTYDDNGINSVAAAILQVFAKAADTDHQYIMQGYTVNIKDYEYLKKNYAVDVQARNLPLVKGRYSRLNSIHTVRNVELTVTL
ncbi:MAG: DUF3383 domain-containing protein [Fibrobacter sp.]|nr:DUF3383 domain-containing protein [Fibrobacter sp.]